MGDNLQCCSCIKYLYSLRSEISIEKRVPKKSCLLPCIPRYYWTPEHWDLFCAIACCKNNLAGITFSCHGAEISLRKMHVQPHITDVLCCPRTGKGEVWFHTATCVIWVAHTGCVTPGWSVTADTSLLWWNWWELIRLDNSRQSRSMVFSLAW